MKQPEDTKTAELNLELEAQKRGRGRPAKADALTPAERAKRYRDAKRAAGIKAKPTSHREAELELDYTRPTWEDYDTQAAIVNQNAQTIAQLEKLLRLAENERNAAFIENEKLKSRTEELVMEKDRAQLRQIDAETRLWETQQIAIQIKPLKQNVENAKKTIAKLILEKEAAEKEVKRLATNAKKRDASRKLI